MMLRTTTLALFSGLSVASARPLPSRLCPADAKLANLLAASDLVLIGKMDVPKQRLANEARKPSPAYLDIPIQVEGVVKGESIGSTTVRYYPKDAAYKPSNEAVLGLAGARAILFLTRVDVGPVGLYFTGYTPNSLMHATNITVATARTEASRQKQIVASWRADTALPHFAEVQELIARLGHVNGNEQQRVFDRLEALGEAAVPAIIAQMDDRRTLRTPAISLVNHDPNAFEGTRQYRPALVVDGLDAVLNQITGESFGSIENGGSSRQRASTIAGWRIFAADLACKKGS